ncbi:hypothetical protein D2A34_21780 [Clostridium chromiireducens]|uniref:Uncharacterized protein n=1 Tax=Clostridium chromiireducens TaxID=225345 RepID=A0A399IIV5_9CLOT|nr:hypothetical protein [Clostridium chromiireducens]RII32831.1 hypothetical protein D2A34_21780 [Clostridium chromiireducens]
MGVIKDIADVIVPNAQIRAKSKGISNKEALYKEFKKIGYIRSNKVPGVRRLYEEYKCRFIKQGGLESDRKLLTYEEFKEANEKEDNDDY